MTDIHTLADNLKELEQNRRRAAALVARAAEGDHLAFGQLYDLYADALYGVVSRIVRNEAAGADVLQDAMVKIWRNLRKYDKSKGAVFTWMLNIVRNAAIDHLRRSKRTPGKAIQDTSLSVYRESEPAEDMDKSDHIGMMKLLEKLSENQRFVVQRLYFDGFTQQEVSDEFNIPLGTVKTRTRAALKSLRKYFKLLLFWI